MCLVRYCSCYVSQYLEGLLRLTLKRSSKGCRRIGQHILRQLDKFVQRQDTSCTISEVAGPCGRGQESGACSFARLVREHGSRKHSTSTNSFIAEDLLPFGRHVGRTSRLVLFPRTDRSRIRGPHMELLPLVECIECRLCQLWAATLRFNNKSRHADSLCTAVKEPQPEEDMVLLRR